MSEHENQVYMVNEAINGTHWFPDQPGVIEHQEARGWKALPPPITKPFVPDGRPLDPAVQFTTMYHPKVKRTHEFPANPEAIEGAMESGWVLGSGPKAQASEDVPEDKPKKPAKTQAAKDDKGVTENG